MRVFYIFLLSCFLVGCGDNDEAFKAVLAEYAEREANGDPLKCPHCDLGWGIRLEDRETEADSIWCIYSGPHDPVLGSNGKFVRKSVWISLSNDESRASNKEAKEYNEKIVLERYDDLSVGSKVNPSPRKIERLYSGEEEPISMGFLPDWGFNRLPYPNKNDPQRIKYKSLLYPVNPSSPDDSLNQRFRYLLDEDITHLEGTLSKSFLLGRSSSPPFFGSGSGEKIRLGCGKSFTYREYGSVRWKHIN